MQTRRFTSNAQDCVVPRLGFKNLPTPACGKTRQIPRNQSYLSTLLGPVFLLRFGQVQNCPNRFGKRQICPKHLPELDHWLSKKLINFACSQIYIHEESKQSLKNMLKNETFLSLKKRSSLINRTFFPQI